MTHSTTPPVAADLAPILSNLRPVGGDGFQAGRRRTVYRSNTRPVDPSDYPADLELIVDLRRVDEIERLRHPLTDTQGYRHIPLFDPTSQIESAAEAVELQDQYMDWLDRHRRTIPAVFVALAESTGDALVCCSAGKDRTGVVSAILARLWGADLERVGADYAQTSVGLADQFAAALAVSKDPARTRIQQNCVPEVMITVIEHLERRHGSVDGYLQAIGLTRQQIDAL